MIRRNRSTLLASTTLATALLAACGGSVNNGTGGTASATTSTGGGTTASSNASSNASSGSGGAVSCSTFAPAPPASSPVSVRLVNKTSAPMYLGETTASCSGTLGFTLEGAGNKALQPSLSGCEFTCGDLQQQGCACPAGCGAPIVTMVAPGAYYEIPWTRTVFTAKNMPASCFKDPTCASSSEPCVVEELAPAPPLTIKSSAYTQAKGCTPGPCLPCTAGSSGVCTVSGAMTVGGTELKGTVSWMGEAKINVDIQ